MAVFDASNPDRESAETPQKVWTTLGNIGSLAAVPEEKKTWATSERRAEAKEAWLR